MSDWLSWQGTHQVPLLAVNEDKLREACSGLMHDAGQQHKQMPRHALDGVLIEDASVVEQHALNSLGSGGHLQQNVQPA